MVASEPSRTKQALALVYEDHFSRQDFVDQILPPEVNEKEAIDLVLSRLDTLESDDDAKATVAHKWKIYLRSLQDTDKAA